MNTASVKKWVQDAEADGWIITATYENEPKDTASAGEKHIEGVGTFKFLATARGKKTDDIYMWGPDKLAISVPEIYKSPTEGLLKTCPHCRAVDIPTYKYSFAGRACEKCLPVLQKKHEYPGWTD